MADSYACTECGKELPSDKGLRIHFTRVHGDKPDVPDPTKSGNPADAQAAKEKLQALLSRAKFSKIANMLLSGPATRFSDPSILLSPQEQAEIDACMAELMDSYSAGYASKLTPYVPILGLLLVVGPIVWDKYSRITAYGSAGGPNPPPEPRDNAPANPPKLTRGDIQPDLAGAGEADDA